MQPTYNIRDFQFYCELKDLFELLSEENDENYEIMFINHKKN